MTLQVLHLHCEETNNNFNSYKFSSNGFKVLEICKHDRYGLSSDVVVYFNQNILKLIDTSLEITEFERIVFNDTDSFLVRLNTSLLDSPEKAITGVAIKNNKLIIQFNLGVNYLEEKNIFQLVRDLKSS